MQFNINLKSFFEHEAIRSLIPAQKKLVSNKRGVRNDNAPHNKPSYAAKKQFGDWWFVNTKETYANIFQFKAEPLKLTLFANEQQHSGKSKIMTKKYGLKTYTSKNPPTYKKLAEWHTTKFSGYFEQLPVGSNFPNRLGKEIHRQLAPQILGQLSRNWNIKL